LVFSSLRDDFTFQRLSAVYFKCRQCFFFFFCCFLPFPLPFCCGTLPPFVRLPGGGVLKSSLVRLTSGPSCNSPFDNSRRSAMMVSSSTESLFHVRYA